MKKICVVTGTRAEYGLLRWVIDGIEKSNILDLQIIATGMHISPEFGLTYQEIEKDGFHIDKKVEMLVSSDTPNGVVKCNAKVCGTCAYILETDVVRFQNVNTNVITNFNILRPFNCLSKDVIYKIICRGCEEEFYIGETVHLRNRVTNHKFDFSHVEDKIEKHESIMKVHMHLYDCAIMLHPPFYIVPFYQVRRKTLTARLTVEKYFMRKFHPTLNG